MNQAQAIAALTGLNREQVKALVALTRSVAESTVKATVTKWDDLIFNLVDPIVFSDAAVDKICSLLGIP